MKIFDFSLNKEFHIPDYISNDETICFLDIETDGLSHSRNRVVLVGLFVIDLKNSVQVLFQLFSEKNSDEPLLLKKLNEIISGVDTVFTYNGASFDIPFLKKRFDSYSIPHELDSIFHIDLMKKVKKNKDILLLQDCKLKTVERRIGIHREDTISGRDSVLLYKEYLKTQSPALEKTILKHNYEDIFYLPNILEIEKLLDSNVLIALDLSGKRIKLDIPVDKVKISKSTLKVSGLSSSLDTPDYVVFEDLYSFKWIASSGEFTFEMFLDSGLDEFERLLYYVDLYGISSVLPITEINNGGLDLPPNILPLSISKEILYSNVIALVEAILLIHI